MVPVSNTFYICQVYQLSTSWDFTTVTSSKQWGILQVQNYLSKILPNKTFQLGWTPNKDVLSKVSSIRENKPSWIWLVLKNCPAAAPVAQALVLTVYQDLPLQAACRSAKPSDENYHQQHVINMIPEIPPLNCVEQTWIFQEIRPFWETHLIWLD